MLDRAEGILLGLRRCSIDAAFNEIVEVSRRHGVPALRVSRALVKLAEGRDPDDADAAAVARQEWSSLLPNPMVAQ
jgi:hypothetical protein